MSSLDNFYDDIVKISVKLPKIDTQEPSGKIFILCIL